MPQRPWTRELAIDLLSSLAPNDTLALTQFSPLFFLSLSLFSLVLHATTRQNVTQPPVEPKLVTGKYGFVDNAERLNSRAAMVSFVFSSLSFALFFFFRSPLAFAHTATTTSSSTTQKTFSLSLSLSKTHQMGFFGILLVELVAGKGIFEIVGINVGNGLGFSF